MSPYRRGTIVSVAPGVAATAILLATAACDPAEIHTLHTLHTDSAGIPIVTAVAPLWGPDDAWTVDPEPLVEIGTVTGSPEYQFSEVVAAVRLGNGSVVVADRGASELRSYDAAGSFEWASGRFGEGSGEFQSLDFVGRTAGDSLVSYDSSLMRVQLFDSGGRLARTLQASAPAGEATRLGSVADKAVGVVNGRLIVRFIDLGATMETGIVRWPSGSPESNIPTGNRLTVYRTARSAFPAVGLDLAGPSRQSGETGVNRRDSRAGRTGLSNRVREPLWSHHIRRSPKLDFRSPRFHLWWVRRRPRDVATGLIPPDSVSREGMS